MKSKNYKILHPAMKSIFHWKYMNQSKNFRNWETTEQPVKISCLIFLYFPGYIGNAEYILKNNSGMFKT